MIIFVQRRLICASSIVYCFHFVKKDLEEFQNENNKELDIFFRNFFWYFLKTKKCDRFSFFCWSTKMTCSLSYKIFTIVIYDRNAIGQYYETTIIDYDRS